MSVSYTHLDHIKAQGYKYSTRGAITVAVCDAVIPPAKKEIIKKAEADVDAVREWLWFFHCLREHCSRRTFRTATDFTINCSRRST